MLWREIERRPEAIAFIRSGWMWQRRGYYGLLLKEREKGTAILLVLEDLEDIFRIADRVAVMYQGSISGILEVNKTSIEEIGSLMVGAQLTGVENG